MRQSPQFPRHFKMPPKKKIAAAEEMTAQEEDVVMAEVPAGDVASEPEAEDADPAVLAHDEQRISIVG
jgi:hypothetical protein